MPAAVRAEHATLPKALDDPRVMQTLLALQGMGAMTYTDEDMRRAEREGKLAARPHPLAHDGRGGSRRTAGSSSVRPRRAASASSADAPRGGGGELLRSPPSRNWGLG